jgi:hypothetical protein
MILADNYEQPAEFDPISIDGRCLFCGGSNLEATLRSQFFVVACVDCEQPLAGHPVTPTLVRSHDGADLVEMVGRKMAIDYRQIRNGICVGCTGPLSTTILDSEDLPVDGAYSFLVRDTCEECLRQYNGPLSYGVAYHPASVAFHWDHGIDITSTALWEFHEYARDGAWTAEKRASDPAEYVVELRQDEDMLRLYLDAAADVTRTERVRRHSGAGSQ